MTGVPEWGYARRGPTKRKKATFRIFRNLINSAIVR